MTALRLAALSVLLVMIGCSLATAQSPRFALAVERATVCASDADTEPDFAKARCKETPVWRIDPQGAPLWLRATIDAPAEVIEAGRPLAVHLGAFASSELYWNGQRIGNNGAPGVSRADEEVGQLDFSVFVPASALRAGENVITIRMSSFHNPIRVVAPFHYLYVAEASALASPLSNYYVPTLVTAGAFILAAVYFGILWLRNRQDKGALLVAMMAAFAAAQLGAEATRAYVAYPYPWQVWRLIAICACAAGFSLSLCAYVARRFQGARWPIWVGAAALGVASTTALTPGFDGKTVLAVLGPTLVALVAVAWPAWKGAPGARFGAAALIVFTMLILVDRETFLDRSFYLAAALALIVAFADQARAMQAARAARHEAESRASHLELELLRRTIAPHFLMNTLNALAEWVESDPRTGVRMIDAIADEFRLLSRMSAEALTSLADEIALCRRRLDVMSYRVDRRFSLTTDGVDERLQIPPGVLHTLIENAFTHGRYADGAAFRLKQETEHGRVTLTLVTPPTDGEGRAGGGGAGRAYIERRLEAAFGETSAFEDGPTPEGGWRSVLSFASART